MTYKILIADDEQGILSMLRDYFEFHGFMVFTATSGTEALKAVSNQPDIILLDINMPDITGLEVCRRIREYVSCPIIFLTARIEESDAVRGFLSGGDDYVVKPFKMGELGARVQAHLRRQNRNIHSMTTKFFEDLTIDYSGKEILYANKSIPFTKKEYEIIELLTLNANQIFDRERIYERVWGYDGEGDSSVVVEHIRRIRNKFLQHTGRSCIETVWGCGYRWKE